MTTVSVYTRSTWFHILNWTFLNFLDCYEKNPCKKKEVRKKNWKCSGKKTWNFQSHLSRFRSFGTLTFPRRPTKAYLQYVFLKCRLPRRLQDVFARRLAIVSSRRLGRQKNFTPKTSSRRLHQDEYLLDFLYSSCSIYSKNLKLYEKIFQQRSHSSVQMHKRSPYIWKQSPRHVL